MWRRRILIGAGVALALLIGLVLIAAYFTPGGPVAQSISVTVGDRTVTVGGHYKSIAQEDLADGLSVKVDGHDILLSGDQLTVDGETQVLEPGRDVEIWVDESGKVSIKVVSAETAPPS
jgi:hypothetical protein